MSEIIKVTSHEDSEGNYVFKWEINLKAYWKWLIEKRTPPIFKDDENI